MGPRAALLILTLQLLGETRAAYDPSKCTIPADTTDALPLFDDNFYVFTEKKFVSGAAITFVENVQLYFSQVEGRAYIHESHLGNTTDAWVEAGIDQVIASVNSRTVPAADSCQAIALDGSRAGIDLAAKELSGSKMALGNASEVMQFHREAHKTAKMENNFFGDRGMFVEIWKTCNYWQETDTTAVITWMFNDVQQTLMPSSDKRLLIHGEATGTNGQTGKPFRYVYDFSGYTFDVDSETDKAFEVPSSLYCLHAVTSQTLPMIPDYFRYKGEQITQYFGGDGKVTLDYFEETYLGPLKLFVRESEATPNPGSPNDDSYFRTVTDFNTGLQYTANLKTGSCSVTPIPPFNVGAFTIANGKVQMRTSSQFFDMDSNGYQYMGVHRYKTRGVVTDSYTTFFTDSDTHGRKNSLYTWDFANNNWQYSHNYQTYKPLPVAVTVMKDTATFTMNIFEYATDIDRPVPDVSLCYSESQAIPVEIYFNGRFEQVVTPDPYGFQSTFRLTVMGVTQILSPLRVAKIDVQPAGTSQIVVRFLLLDAPAQKGNVNFPITGVTATAGLNSITSLVAAGNFVLSINRKDGTTAQATAASAGTFDRGQFHGVQKAAAQATTYTAGAMAGIALGMLVLGLLLAVVAVFLVKRLRGSSTPEVKGIDNPGY